VLRNKHRRCGADHQEGHIRTSQNCPIRIKALFDRLHATVGEVSIPIGGVLGQQVDEQIRKQLRLELDQALDKEPNQKRDLEHDLESDPESLILGLFGLVELKLYTGTT
jgi:hypothetical protein